MFIKLTTRLGQPRNYWVAVDDISAFGDDEPEGGYLQLKSDEPGDPCMRKETGAEIYNKIAYACAGRPSTGWTIEPVG